MQNYVIWCITKGGWVTPTSTYTSQVKDARTYEYAEAMKLCSKHKYMNDMDWIPVNLLDLNLLREKKK